MPKKLIKLCLVNIFFLIFVSCKSSNENTTLEKIKKKEIPKENDSSTFVDASDSFNESSPGIDPLEVQAWHLNNIGQASFSSNGGIAGEDLNLLNSYARGELGSGIKIAVSDNGLEVNQEDLIGNFLAGQARNYSSSNSAAWSAGGDPRPPSDQGINAHGTAVSGIISGMDNNSLGSRGIAPLAKFTAFRYIGVSSSVAKDIDQANGNFDIFNYSYGRSSCVFHDLPESYIDQLKFGVTNLRSGRGAIYIKAGGNEYVGDSNDCTANSNSVYFGNANLEEDNSYPYMIVVGAVNALGISASYSSPGSSLWISAPGGEFGDLYPAIISTDLMSCSRGFSTSDNTINSFEAGSPENLDCNYTSTMNGTSSAAPAVSGAVAVILGVNPTLSWRDVKYILAKTARKIDPNRGDWNHPGASLALAGHVYEFGWRTNNAGFNYHNWYGFGAVDVDAAVDMAKTYSTNLGELKETVDQNTGGWKYATGNINLDIPDESAVGVTSEISVTDVLEIEAVQIKVDLEHSYIGDIGIELTSPVGTVSKLMNINSLIVGSNLSEGLLLSNHFFGESSQGNWQIKIIDGNAQDVGKLIRWQINFFGHDPIGIRGIASASAENLELSLQDKLKISDFEKREEFYKYQAKAYVETPSSESLREVNNRTRLSHQSTVGRVSREPNSKKDKKIKKISDVRWEESDFMKKLGDQFFQGKIDGDKEIFDIIAVKEELYIFGRSKKSPFIALLNNKFELVWVKKVEGSEGIKLSSIKMGEKGSFFAVGNKSVDDKFTRSLIKFDKEGSILWKRDLDENSRFSNFYTFLSITKDGGLLIGGHTYGKLFEPNGGGRDLFVEKRDGEGALLWGKQLGLKSMNGKTYGDEDLVFIEEKKSGEIILFGNTTGLMGDRFFGDSDFLGIQMSQSGEVLLVKQWGSDKKDTLTSVIRTPSQSYILEGKTAGNMYDKNESGQDIVILEIDHYLNKKNHHFQMGASFGRMTHRNEKVSSMIFDQTGKLCIAGEIDSSVTANSNNRNIFYMRFDDKLKISNSYEFDYRNNQNGAVENRRSIKMFLDSKSDIIFLGEGVGTIRGEGEKSQKDFFMMKRRLFIMEKNDL